jgi:hypothetical protein
MPVAIDGTVGSLANGSSNLTIGAGSAITINVAGTANVLTVNTANLLPTGNGTVNLGSTSNRFGNLWGLSSSAQYADLAEMFLADEKYPIGTVLMIGGIAEVTVATKDSRAIVGTVSDKPAFLMNDGLTGDTAVPIAYIGRVPCRVEGEIKKGDLLIVSNNAGIACSTTITNTEVLLGKLIGKALEDSDGSKEVIEIVVGRL